MNSIFNQLLNVKGVVVETVRIVDSPLRPEPVLEVRVRPRRGMLRCSPLWQTSSWLRPRWRRASLASSGFRLLAGRTGRHDAARGLSRVRGRGRVRAVGGTGQPVHARLRVRVRVADERPSQDGIEPLGVLGVPQPYPRDSRTRE